jgi:hypothetical protein
MAISVIANYVYELEENLVYAPPLSSIFLLACSYQ